MSTLIRRYPGNRSSVPLIRAWTLEHVPADVRDAAALMVSEAATNALLHSRSGLPGGTITISIRPLDDGAIRIAVTDQGDTASPAPDPARNGGRGLALIHAFTRDCGLTGGPNGHTFWADLTTAPARGRPPR